METGFTPVRRMNKRWCYQLWCQVTSCIHEISQGYFRPPACWGHLKWYWVTVRRMMGTPPSPPPPGIDGAVTHWLRASSPPPLLNWVMFFQAGEMSGAVAKWDLRSRCSSGFTSVQINAPPCHQQWKHTCTWACARFSVTSGICATLNCFFVEWLDIFQHVSVNCNSGGSGGGWMLTPPH